MLLFHKTLLVYGNYTCKTVLNSPFFFLLLFQYVVLITFPKSFKLLLSLKSLLISICHSEIVMNDL